MNVRTALHQGQKLLEESHVDSPRLTAELLLCHALQKERIYLYTHPEAELSEIAWLHFGRYLFHRMKGKPAQYITRRQEFYGREFVVSPAVLIPRPETELVVERALELMTPESRVLDVGVGSGAIAATLQLESDAPVWASDISRDALAVASSNIKQLKARVDVVQCDLASAFRPRSMDLIVSNPPYIADADRATLQREVVEHEPSVALFAGPLGTELYMRLIDQAEQVLKPGGWLVLELGYNSLDGVRQKLSGAWTSIDVRPDLAQIPRVLSARLL
jgi:release factor glutamine methyltransferase